MNRVSSGLDMTERNWNNISNLLRTVREIIWKIGKDLQLNEDGKEVGES